MNTKYQETYQSNTLAEKIEYILGMEQKAKAIPTGIKMGALTAALMTLYFIIFTGLSFKYFLLAHLAKLFVIGMVMFTGFYLFRHVNHRMTFLQGLKLATTNSLIAAFSLMMMEILLSSFGSTLQLQPQMYAQLEVSPILLSFVSFIEVMAFGMISGIACILFFTKRKGIRQLKMK